MLTDFRKLIKWSKREFNDLPWRHNRTLYTTLVSEIMLQQTTVGTVLNHFDHFIKEYPTLKKLALASEEDLLISWKGLGYYRRAKNLRKACLYIHKELNGHFPETRDELLEIPGVGPYTASAIMAIGSDKDEIAVDANLERVLARYYSIKIEKGLKLQAHLRDLFLKSDILKFSGKISFRDINESLMDLGRTYCKARSADCVLCPLSKGCISFQKKDVLKLPINSMTKKKVEKHEL